jgi:RimJ/RimL family protein N-acetyltransferase
MKRLQLSRSFVYGNRANPEINNLLRRYVATRLHGDESVYADCGSLGIVSDKKLLGAVLFHNWQPDFGTIELSAAADSPRWLLKQTIREIMGICFDQLQCQQIFSRMAADNERAAQIYEFLGFNCILLPNMRGAGKHEYLMLLTVDEWRENKLNNP